jgi:peptidyl-tRNA hydrolase
MGAFAFREAEGRASAFRMQKFVLQKFNKEEERILKGVIKKVVGVIESLLKEGLEKTMNEFNKQKEGR